jgi:hypothetical protein
LCGGSHCGSGVVWLVAEALCCPLK